MKEMTNNNTSDNKVSENRIPTWKRKLIRSIWFLFIVGFIAVILLFALIYNGVVGYMPPVEELKNPSDKFATVVYSSDGQELGR